MAIYQKDYIDKKEEEMNLVEFQAWINGMYIVNAIQTAIDPMRCKYPKNPFSEETDGEENTEIGAVKFWEYAEAFNKVFEKKKVGENIVE